MCSVVLTYHVNATYKKEWPVCIELHICNKTVVSALSKALRVEVIPMKNLSRLLSMKS